MRYRNLLLGILLVMAVLLSACGGGAAPAAELPDAPGGGAEESSYEKLPDEPYAAVDYDLYPAPEGGYVGDVMPFVTEDGTLELYYLYDTDHNGQGYHPIYKYSTEDLSGYEDHGMVLNYGQMSDPDPAPGTGCVMQDPDGLYHLFYTGHNDSGNGGMGTECAMHAHSTDRENWVKDGVLFYAPENYSKDDFRDPEVFWVEEENCYWLLIAARENTLGGVVLKYTSEDLLHWDFIGPIFAPMSQYMLECPDLFCIGDTWYLTYSWDCTTYYAMSDSMGGPFVAPKDNTLDGKGLADGNGFIFYAGKTAQMGDKLYLCGWLGRAGVSGDSGFYQWAGSIMNHQIIQREDKTLGIKAPDVFADYFTIDKLVFAAPLTDGVTVDGNNISLAAADEDSYALADMGTRPASMTLECDVTLDEEGCAGFAFGGSDRDETFTALCLDARRNLLHYEGYEIDEIRTLDPAAVNKFDFSKSNTHHVKLVCENEIVVLYIDDAKALSSRISHSIDGAHIGVFAQGCEAEFTNISIKIPG